MSLWIDHKYMGLLSFRLERFTRKDKNLYNFRCPICGDSHKNKFKARGYAMAKQDKIFFYCHNCGANRSMYDFVKEIDPELHKQYVTTGRAKGLKERRLLVKYPLRMALNPFIADIGNLIPSLVSGSVIVSVVLNLPTVGPVLLTALQSQDQYLAGFVLLFVAVLTLFGMLVSDLLLAVLDPRIRLGGRAAS